MDRYGAIETFRGLSAVLVALGAWMAISGGEPGGAYEAQPFHLFADAFLVLTGFIVARVYRDRIDGSAGAAEFMLLRLARIYPLHIFVLALFVGVETVRMGLEAAGAVHGAPQANSGDRTSVEGFAAHLAMVQVFTASPTWNAASWVISVEFLMCLAFAGLCLTGVTRSGLGRGALALSVVAAVVYVAAEQAGTATQGAAAVARGYAAFMAGALAQSCARSRWLEARVSAAPLWLAGGLEAAALLGLGLALASEQGQVMAVAGFAAVLLLFQFERGLVSRLVAHRALRGIGALAYPILISHYLIVQPVADLVSVEPVAAARAVLATPLYLALISAMAVLFAIYVETPTREAMRTWIDRVFETSRRQRAVAVIAEDRR